MSRKRNTTRRTPWRQTGHTTPQPRITPIGKRRYDNWNTRGHGTINDTPADPHAGMVAITSHYGTRWIPKYVAPRRKGHTHNRPN